MDPTRFDSFTRALTQLRSTAATPRRAALKLLARGALGAILVRTRSAEVVANRKKKKKKGLKLRALCTLGKSTCGKGLKCGQPTTRHTCDSTTPDTSDWCCVPPGGSCTECDCCGDFYCEPDDNNQFRCVPNPEM